MKMPQILWIAIIVTLTIAIILISIFLIHYLWIGIRVNEVETNLLQKLSKGNISALDLVQTTASLLAILIAVYALTKDSSRDKESSKRYETSVNMEKKQHEEIMTVYDEQKTLLSQYNISANKMLEQQQIQAKTAQLQFENQKVLTQPMIIVNHAVHDQKLTSFKYIDNEWIMPEVAVILNNIGGRIASNITAKIQFISPNAKTIHNIGEVEFLELFPKGQIVNYSYPAIHHMDKNFFIMVIDLKWIDKFDDNKINERRFINKFLREPNNTFTSGMANGEHEILTNEILKSPSHTINSNENLRKIMYDIYNR